MKQKMFLQGKQLMDGDDKYSRAIRTPQYIPSKVKPDVSELCDYKKYSQLVRNIDKSSISDEEKKFLKLAASRHIVFNYSKIADYYAHASSEMQRLMEESALVILDIDDAVANGYVRLSERLNQLIHENREKQSDD